MRRAIKIQDSEILIEHLGYRKNDSRNNQKIAAILYAEQKGFCAYTDELLSRTESEEK